MKHNRSETPAYLLWVEQRPSLKGKGKQAYFEAVELVAKAEIEQPIETYDIEVEIIYTTSQNKHLRMDTDNVTKPTLDALKSFAYLDDRQVRHASSTLFDKTQSSLVHGLVEHIGRLFYSNEADVILIMIYSDSRLAELGGENEVLRKRYQAWEQSVGQVPEKEV